MKPKIGIDEIQPYQGGKPIEEVQRELGIGNIIKLASNENPLGPSPLAVASMKEAMSDINLYPDGNIYYLKRDLAVHLGVLPENLLLGNGSNEVLQIVGETFISPNDEVIFSESAFVVYQLVSKICSAKSVIVPMLGFDQDLGAMADAITDRTKVIFVANPNNPTGTMVTKNQVEQLIERVPGHVLIIFDEAYCEYINRSDYPQTINYISEKENIIITRTFAKIYGLAGLRIGYGISSPEIIDLMNRVRQPFNCNTLAQVAARAALKDYQHVRESRELNERGKTQLYHFFDEIGLDYVRSEGNFILVHFDTSGQEIADQLLQKGVIVRPVAGYGFPNSIRVTIGTAEENQRFISTLEGILQTT
ncbi:TPA: histidinol-phosphate transaminase [Candidatus Poribacteria bacterium]|nr:histidinol-phosphate transaminase [Candidatus Poribacteria bacterium]HIA69710.1 histidinol-phosphate transaminase [Candidatus Poribacteria bacterium]HIB86836.1 histidinol-phosphate transaminase [Candidatus Poribacteria bacterium]HIC02231.1 histidinol-phosphate transaminase [Candidatus Poribacteria bacterium]HIN27390.1 histidinol-phosphate transaminase [Candidatus Poribacteria bacterium]